MPCHDLFDGYKTGEGVDGDLRAQFPLVERASRALGIATWPMTELEADDALATAAAHLDADDRVDRRELLAPRGDRRGPERPEARR